LKWAIDNGCPLENNDHGFLLVPYLFYYDSDDLDFVEDFPHDQEVDVVDC
jgi:hypothetical protein